jgi:sugar lactone lactonase YvrE
MGIGRGDCNMRLSALLATSLVILGPVPAPAAPPVLVWEAHGFHAPESARYDAKRKVLYISNINGDPAAKDGNGTISRLSPDGRMLQADWVTGLDAPKGLALQRDRLFVADIDTLVEIDVTNGRIVARFHAKGAKFLNDVTAEAGGNIYVSDMQGGTVYRLHEGVLSQWLPNDKRALCSPNGLYAARDHLVVGCWSQVVDEFDTVEAGHLKGVDYRDKRIYDIGHGKPIGHIDGVEPDGRRGYYLTDWLAGRLLHMDAAGDVTVLAVIGQGAADEGWIPSRHLLVVPMMNDDVVRAYRVGGY